MCGIFAEFDFKKALQLRRSIECLNILQHRGPDGYGFEFGELNARKYILNHNGADIRKECRIDFANYFLGHRRLSIVDLSDAAFQPMESPDRTCSIIFNGEIYNHVELRRELLEDGYIFHTGHSDTEVILNAYLKWGAQCLEQLRGMFAFAIYDRRSMTVFMARDRIGKKPLYYELSDTSFALSSELAPLVNRQGTRRSINPEALNHYILLGYVPHPYSIFDGIRKLPPASFAIYSLRDRTFAVHNYWDVNGGVDASVTEEGSLNMTDELLDESVMLRLRADVPVGAFVSGGTDSTLVVKKIKEISGKRFDIYGADFPKTDRSEKRYIEEAAAKYDQNLNLSSIDLTHIANIDGIINVFDEPFDGGSSIALFDLLKNAAKRYKVILTGDGGDEMFAGYPRYVKFPRQHNIYRTIGKLYLFGEALALLISLGLDRPVLKKLKGFLDGDMILNYMRNNNDFSSLDLLSPGIRVGSVEDMGLFSEIRQAVRKYEYSPIKMLQYFDMKTILPGRMLYKLDRFSMFYGVEARSPFLDHKLVEMAFAMPDEHNVAGNNTKLILKKILLKDFSREFVFRKKQGFGNPLSYWFRRSDPEKIFRVLHDRSSKIFSYLDYERLHAYLPQIKRGYDGTCEKEIWRFLVLGIYLERHREVIT